MTGTTAEAAGAGSTREPLAPMRRSSRWLSRAATARGGMVMNVVMMDVDVQNILSGVPARTAEIMRMSRGRGTVGDQGFQKAGPTTVPTVVLGASSASAVEGAGRDVVPVRPRGQRSSTGSGDLAARFFNGGARRRLGPPGRGGRQCPNQARPRAGTSATRGLTRLTLHAVPGSIHRPGKSSSPSLPVAILEDSRSGREAWSGMRSWSGRRSAADGHTRLVHRSSNLRGLAALRLFPSASDT